MKNFRLLLFIILGIGVFLSFFVFLQFSELLFNIHNKYQNTPTWLLAFYFIGIALLALVAMVLLYKVSRIGSKPTTVKPKKREVTDDTSFHEKLGKLSDLQGNTLEIEAEWQQLVKIRSEETINIALFGEVNVGKSSIIASLIDDNRNTAEISAKAGATQQIIEHSFSHQSLDYCLFDMPGVFEAFGNMTEISYQTAIKSHVVVFVIDEEFTHSTFAAYQKLLTYQKPIVVAINKADFYRKEEKSQIYQRINQQFNAQNLSQPPLVWVQAKSTKTVEKHHADGQIESSEVTIPANLDDLLLAIENLASNQILLNEQLDSSYFQLLEEKIDTSLQITRRQQAEKIVKSHMQRAVIGGMATIGPGTDILLQGYFCVDMTKKICKIYEVDAKEIDIESLVSAINGKVKKQISIVLALVGNVLKAFPGIGTITGGAVHAVAYGLIFESVGNALIKCFEQNNQFEKKDIIKALEDELSENLESRTRKLVQTVLFKK